MRHSAYYDFGATMRIAYWTTYGLPLQRLEEMQIGPILFREEAIFRREVHLDDTITIDVEFMKATRDYSRWSLRHQIKKDDGTLCCIINIDGAWIDLVKRKLAVPNEFITGVFERLPKAEGFEWIEKK